MIRAPSPARVELLLDLGAPAAGSRNMALDEALMEVGRTGGAALRLYAWDPPCLSLGRNQPTPARPGGRPRAAWRPGREVVRRPTGGRSVYHGPELTYAFACADRMWGGPRAIYRRVNRAIARGLAALGVSLDEAPPAGRRAAVRGLGPDACFRAPAPGEVTVGGRKLVGSAQWRHRGAILQHGSILIRNEQARGALVGGPDGAAARAATDAAVALADLLSPPPDGGRLADGVARGFARELGAPLAEAGWSGALLEAARSLEPRYRSAAWTWRR